MSKVAIITDLHFGARGDATTFVDYMDKFYTNTFFPTLKERGITHCLNVAGGYEKRELLDEYASNGIAYHSIAADDEDGYPSDVFMSMEDLFHTQSQVDKFIKTMEGATYRLKQ